MPRRRMLEGCLRLCPSSDCDVLPVPVIRHMWPPPLWQSADQQDYAEIIREDNRTLLCI